MLKGCQREMIVLQTRESPLFENAYFVLRRGRRQAPARDMLAEANRIIGAGGDYLSRRRRFRWIIPFFGGLATGGGVFAVILCLIWL